MIAKELIKYLDSTYPNIDASDFDKSKIGFNIGDENIEIKGIMFALDLTKEVLEEAINNNCNFIITHHPFIWEPFYNFNHKDYRVLIIKKMLENNICLYSMHTNLDVNVDGVNYALAKRLGLENIKSLYDENKDNFLRYGNINETTLEDFIKTVKEKLELTGVRVIGNLNKKVKTVGLIGGAGGGISELNEAIKAKCDVYITGEVRLNCAIYAKTKNLSVIEVNHGVERFVFNHIYDKFKNDLKEKYNYENNIIISSIVTDPFITC